jgi:phage-related protein
MMPWFVWKDKSSYSDFGLWINRLPPITKPSERHEEITIPGRAGHLTLLEGDGVYESYVKRCTVVARADLDFQRITSWLQGSGDVTFSNEPDRAYSAEILDPVEFAYEGNSLKRANILFYCQPLKHQRTSQQYVFAANGSIYNPGDVASRPVVTVNYSGTGTKSVYIGGSRMQFTFTSSNNGNIVVDCGAEVITRNGSIWSGSFTGNFWRIPQGISGVSMDSGVKVMIDANWGWL